jgi:hypothetical protein
MRRAAELESVELDGEIVIYDERDHSIHHLNPTASLVWNLSDGTATIPELAAELSPVFGVAESVIERDLRAVIRQMGDAGLMEVPKPRRRLDVKEQVTQ